MLCFFFFRNECILIFLDCIFVFDIYFFIFFVNSERIVFVLYVDNVLGIIYLGFGVKIIVFVNVRILIEVVLKYLRLLEYVIYNNRLIFLYKIMRLYKVFSIVFLDFDFWIIRCFAEVFI